ncbi:DNA topoisomerase-3 [Ochrobactrum anthropi]|uniref:DNA topoisomerase n=1 Tax=Brucella anthropi TaxID=529 RepID=UPI0015F9DEFD|nr:DNA topoisomerase [Brucella anthropi]MBA8862723.1 DNA topoisomerase-3 [Brucella anthropi]
MSSVVICEKPSQARRIQSIIGNSHGKVLSARGHLLRLEQPGEVKPEWQKWTDDVLVPPDGTYAFVPDGGDGKQKLLDDIGSALKTATRVIVATDTDREGQLIGEAIIRHFSFSGEIMRAWWKTEDELAFRNAFDNLKPNEDYKPLYESGLARIQVDQIFNLTMTRVATNRLRPQGWKSALGIGRVKTPTLGIVCKRELEIRNFVSRDYFEVSAVIAAETGNVKLWHRPRGETRLFDRVLTERIRQAAAAYNGPIAVSSERKKALPPKPLDLTALQKLAGPWGWSAAKVLEVTQSLYETHTLVTYPRAESRYLPENIADEAPALLEGLRAIDGFAALVPDEAVIRNGKSGTYSNAGLNGAPHHAIIPNVNIASEFAERYGKLSADERKLFDAIARAWLAAVSPDHEYDETAFEIDVPLGDKVYGFSVKGKVVVKPGWKAVFAAPDDKDDDGENDEAEEGHLPAIANGAIVTVNEAELHARKTEPPKRYTEGELPAVMQAAWKFVSDPEERERLKETNGIGTTATRASIIEGLKEQNFLEIVKAKIVPTDLGLAFYDIIVKAAPELADPGATARLEERLNSIYRSQADASAVIKEGVERTTRLVAALIEASVNNADNALNSISRPPSPAMIDAAKAKAKRDSVRLSKEITESFDACRAFLGPMRAAGQGASEKQITFAKKLAEQDDRELPDDVLADARKLANWIDQATKARGQTPASPKQMEWINKLVGDGAKPPKGFPDAVTASDAKKFLDSAFSSKGKTKRK